MVSTSSDIGQARVRLHPTKEELINTVVIMLDTSTLDEITSEHVLDISGISRGSLYHHFEDFSELLELALVRRFASYVDKSLEVLSHLLDSCNTREELIARLRDTSQYFQSPELAAIRLERFAAISRVPNNPRMSKYLGFEQERLTELMADLYQEILARGWGNPKMEPRTASVMLQALTLGRVVDDITEDHVNHENWLTMIEIVMQQVFFPGN
jgi:AcrR family transcriptional regulator